MPGHDPRRMMRPRWVGVLLLGAVLLAGCSGIKTYPNDLPKNLLVRTEATSGSAFSSMRVALHVHQVDASCRTEYQGTVQLNEPSIGVGVPAGRMSYLVFTFSGSSLLGGSSSTRYETLLQPRAGYTYDARVRYKDGIYHVEIRESGARGVSARELERRNLADCGRS
jgi:hypothetical protein